MWNQIEVCRRQPLYYLVCMMSSDRHSHLLNIIIVNFNSLITYLNSKDIVALATSLYD